MQRSLAIVLLIAVIAVSGCTTGATTPLHSQAQSGEVTQPDGTILKPDGTMIKPDGTMVKPDGTVVPPEPGSPPPAPVTGSFTKAPYVDYTPEAFAAAQAAGKTSYLYFYAAWCPICRAHDPIVADAINTGPSSAGFDTSKVAAFRVNYDVRGDAHVLCQPPYQHFTCILKGSDVVFKTGAVQDKATIISTLAQYG